jgi:hypothetical protein
MQYGNRSARAHDEEQLRRIPESLTVQVERITPGGRSVRATISLTLLGGVFCARAVLAQQQVVVSRNVNLRPQPTTAASESRTLVPPEPLTLLDPDPSGGYYHVRTKRGEDGWVWGRNISLGSRIAPIVAPLVAAGEFAFALSTCPPVGKYTDSATGTLKKYSATSDGGLRNMAKRHIPTAGTPRTLTLADFEAMQTSSNGTLGNAALHKSTIEPPTLHSSALERFGRSWRRPTIRSRPAISVHTTRSKLPDTAWLLRAAVQCWPVFAGFSTTIATSSLPSFAL